MPSVALPPSGAMPHGVVHMAPPPASGVWTAARCGEPWAEAQGVRFTALSGFIADGDPDLCLQMT